MVGVEIGRSVIGILPSELLEFGFRRVGGTGGPYVLEFENGIVWARRRCGQFRFKVVYVNRSIDINFHASDIAAMAEILGIVMDALHVSHTNLFQRDKSYIVIPKNSII